MSDDLAPPAPKRFVPLLEAAAELDVPSSTAYRLAKLKKPLAEHGDVVVRIGRRGAKQGCARAALDRYHAAVEAGS